MKQSISELQQTVKKQSRVIEQLSNGTVTVDEGGTTEPLDSSFAGGEELWAVMEPFVEQHMEDREVRKREEAQQKIEEAMAKSRERRNEQLAEQLGLNPFQAEHWPRCAPTSSSEEMICSRRESASPIHRNCRRNST